MNEISLFQALKRMREYDKKIAEGEAKARALTQQRELRDQLLGRDAEPTSSSAVDQGSESSFSSMSVGIKLWIKGDCVQGNASTAYDIGKIKILIEEKFVCVGSNFHSDISCVKFVNLFLLNLPLL